MTYTPQLVVAIIENFEAIESFLEKTTSELFQCFYEYPDDSDFWQSEGNTIQDRGPHNTRIPKIDSLKENLIVMKADVESALHKLAPSDQIAVIYHYQLVPGGASKRVKAKNLAIEAIDKMVLCLNG